MISTTFTAVHYRILFWESESRSLATILLYTDLNIVVSYATSSKKYSLPVLFFITNFCSVF